MDLFGAAALKHERFNDDDGGVGGGGGGGAAGGSKAPADTPAWCQVAELTGLGAEAATALLEAAHGDVEMALSLHFDGAAAVAAVGRKGVAVGGKRRRRRQGAGAALRTVSADPDAGPARRARPRGRNVFAELAGSNDDDHDDHDAGGGDAVAAGAGSRGTDGDGAGMWAGITPPEPAGNGGGGVADGSYSTESDGGGSGGVGVAWSDGDESEFSDGGQSDWSDPDFVELSGPGASDAGSGGCSVVDSDDAGAGSDSPLFATARGWPAGEPGSVPEPEPVQALALEAESGEPGAGVAHTALKGDFYVCRYTKKRFKSLAAFENYTKSKKYKLLCAKAGVPVGAAPSVAVKQASSSGAADAATDDDDVLGDGTEPGDSDGAPEPPVAADASGRASDGDDGQGWVDETDEEDAYDEGDDEPTYEAYEALDPWEPRWCESLFDGHESASFEANVRYMQKAHSFFVPEPARLLDPTGLFAYLQEKVCRRYTCLLCNRTFRSLEACRGHMRDKSHCDVNFDAKRGARELALFYKARSAPAAPPAGAAVVTSAAPARHRDPAPQVESGELLLPNGARLGPRSLRKYYKQKFGKDHSIMPVAKKSFRHLQAKAAQWRETKLRNGVLVKSHMFAKGKSKAISSTFVFKKDPADNKARRAIVHHWGAGGGGSHYHMAGSRNFQKGNRKKGLILRHSRQGARMQAARSQKRRTGNVSNSHGGR